MISTVRLKVFIQLALFNDEVEITRLTKIISDTDEIISLVEASKVELVA